MARNLFSFGALLSLVRSCNGDEWTQLTNDLNALIAQGDNGVYTGGSGVLVRNPFDGFSDDTSKHVVPATLWSNDIYSISQIYPNGNPMHPTDGATNDDPWKFAQIGFVIGSGMSDVMYNWDNVQDADWGDGVFYPYDSNSVDKRCRWRPDKNSYDCPGGYIPWGGSWQSSGSAKGTGSYPMGNPNADDSWGGGAGCHMDNGRIDQMNGDDGQGQTLLQNAHCECNYAFKSNDWEGWVDQFYWNVVKKWQGGGSGASFNGDLGMCWMNNPRDMIKLQNQMFWKRTTWSSEKVPYADYFRLDNFDWTRRYWGWNEIPVTRTKIQNPSNWDAIVIMVPAFICEGQDWDNIDCLSSMRQQRLDWNLHQWVQKGYMKVGADAAGSRPGSSVVIARQSADASGNFYTTFFCQDWAGAKDGYYKIVYAMPTDDNPGGGCWLESKDAQDWKQSSEDARAAKPPMNPVANLSGAFAGTPVMV